MSVCQLNSKEVIELIKLLDSRGILAPDKWINSHSEEACKQLLAHGYLHSYLLIEDTWSGYQFWKEISNKIYGSVDVVLNPKDSFNCDTGGISQLEIAINKILDVDDLRLNYYYVLVDDVPDLEGSGLNSRNNIQTLCESNSNIF